MFWNRKPSLPDLCTALAEAMERLDETAANDAFRQIAQQVDTAGPAELTEAAGRLLPALRTVAIGNGGGLATVAAGLVEAGADPVLILDVLVARITDGLEQAARFPALADKAGGIFTAPTGPDEAQATLDRIGRAAATVGIDAYAAGVIMQSWFTVNDWIPALLLPLQQKRARQALPQRDRLTAAVAAMTEHAEDATWLLGLLLVLDDERLVVVHRDSGRAYDVTVSGVGDNFQLHTLLAATLIGDPGRGLIPGEPPRPEWVAAATDGEMAPPDGIRGQFNLVDATGAWIWNEGRPADIPAVDGRRVVVLDPPPYQRGWNVGRVYPLMRPQVTLDRMLPADEAAGWARRVAPAGR